jgi:iduronate 2-sulfatase
MHTPNLDHFASSGTLFNKAYAQYAICSPSRNSFMTGRTPQTNQVWNFLTSFRQNGIGANWTTLPQHFRQNGYFTTGTGKVFHEGAPPQQDYPLSWSFDEMPFGWGGGAMPAGPANTECTDGLVVCDNRTMECAEGINDCPAHLRIAGNEQWCIINETAMSLQGRKLWDEAEAQNAIDRLRFAAKMQTERRENKQPHRPFFLAVGFHKPHLPWIAPSRFFDLYPNASEIVGPKHPLPPIGMPDVAWKPSFGTLPNKPLPAAETKLMRRALYATMSYMDDLFGKVLGELEALSLANSTVVTFIGDHGQHVGEHNLWVKMTNFELAVRVPLLIRVPWLEASIGRRSDELVQVPQALTPTPKLALTLALTPKLTLTPNSHSHSRPNSHSPSPGRRLVPDID